MTHHTTPENRAAQAAEVDSVRQAVAAQFPEMLAELAELVAIPTVSSDPRHRADVEHGATVVADKFRAHGITDVRIVRSGEGKPAVIARHPAPAGAPTILFYAHQDVQPAADTADWNTDPFVLTERDGRLYGRGAADDKAGVAADLAMLRVLGDLPPVGLTFFIEGEEEEGSPTIDALIAEHSELLRADVIVIGDSGNWSVDVPAFTTTLRGVVDTRIDLEVMPNAVHSGVFGGPVPDALSALVRTLASIHDAHGDVAVPGIATARAADLPYSEDMLRAEVGLLPGVECIGTGTVPERLWAKPAIAVLAIDCPRIDGVANILVPRASAIVSMRIPPGQDPDTATDALIAHLRANVPWGAAATFTPGRGGRPTDLELAGPVADLATACFADAWEGTAPVRMGMGGSIPMISLFGELFPEATILVVGPGDPQSMWHGPNESQDIAVLQRLTLAQVLLVRRLAAAAGSAV